jgi:hypothetical protein
MVAPLGGLMSQPNTQRNDGGAGDAETNRLAEDRQRAGNWKRWGPYLSERQWGTVREDYSADGDCWSYFTHDMSRSRAYRWGEDGLLGICDREGRLCFALALWNDRDAILKERLFGLTNGEGNHGEDVKEEFYYLDSSPTHSYMKGLYKYPQAAFPYDQLVNENRGRSKQEREYELVDTGIFKDNRYFDIFVEYAKAGPNDILIKITACNRGPEAAALHLLPTLWFANTWSWGETDDESASRPPPRLKRNGPTSVMADHTTLGRFRWEIEPQTLLFTENDSNLERVFGAENYTPYVKDAFHNYVVHGKSEAVNPAEVGTKAAAYYLFNIEAGQSATVRMRLFDDSAPPANLFGADFENVFRQRIAETDAFYARLLPDTLSPAQRNIGRQAYAGLLWAKQFYHYVVADWLEGDPDQPPPPAQRLKGRNHDWQHVYSRDVISMPDPWEYPWFASWDLAFHTICFAYVDPDFAKQQLVLLMREWYMHPNGELPAYEFAFSDVNPPVHAWACWRVYKMSAPRGKRDTFFLARCFQKLLMNFTWWVNRKDIAGKQIFAGGFLGLDNIGVFDRSQPLPTGGILEQADGTAWMASYCLIMMSIAMELAMHDPSYEDVASKFFEHFVAIVDAINTMGGIGLWDDKDEFYYDWLSIDGNNTPMRVRSIVGLIPLLSVLSLEKSTIDRLPGFKKRMEWFMRHKPDLARHISYKENCPEGTGPMYLLAIPPKEHLVKVLKPMLDEMEFLSPYGIRSVSRIHLDQPYVFHTDGKDYVVKYMPGESENNMFGGNSNWRGPVWFPLNFLLVEALERFNYFYGDDVKVELPTGSGNMVNLQQVADNLASRMTGLFEPNDKGQRPCFAEDQRYASDPWYKNLVLFNEYFDGDTGRGCGATHQTGWTALAGRMLTGISRRKSGEGEAVDAGGGATADRK